MSDSSSLDEAEALDFLDKLAQFHGTLSPAQQTLLDEMTAAALQAPDVDGFVLISGTQPISSLRQTLVGQAGDAKLQYYRYYAGVASLLG